MDIETTFNFTGVQGVLIGKALQVVSWWHFIVADNVHVSAGFHFYLRGILSGYDCLTFWGKLDDVSHFNLICLLVFIMTNCRYRGEKDKEARESNSVQVYDIQGVQCMSWEYVILRSSLSMLT